MRSSLIGLLCLAACGRSELVEEFVADASVVTPPAPIVKEPLYVFEQSRCVMQTTKEALKPASGDRVFAVEFRAQEECSGLGGEWFIGRELDARRDVMLGGHGCFFIPGELRTKSSTSFGVVRVATGRVTAPASWCLTTVDGRTPVESDVRVIAFGVYESEEAARAAAESLQ